MPAVEDKKKYFDLYWTRQPMEKVDPRSLQRAGLVRNLLDNKSGRLLDVGCGRGLILDYFAARDFEVAGLDISPDIVWMVQNRGLEAFLFDLESESLHENYDVILCLEVLQQLYDPLKALRNIKSALSDNSELIVSVPNEFHFVSRLKLLFNRSHLGHFDHSHIRLFTPRRAEELFKAAGFEIKKHCHVPIIPPGWRLFSNIFHPLAQIMPSAWAISSIYSLRMK
jgi:2-polyprenyl-3-methyl-5-hydroxy-6-metoxy-1,4-benzoquinol methylase